MPPPLPLLPLLLLLALLMLLLLLMLNNRHAADGVKDAPKLHGAHTRVLVCRAMADSSMVFVLLKAEERNYLNTVDTRSHPDRRTTQVGSKETTATRCGTQATRLAQRGGLFSLDWLSQLLVIATL